MTYKDYRVRVSYTRGDARVEYIRKYRRPSAASALYAAVHDRLIPSIATGVEAEIVDPHTGG